MKNSAPGRPIKRVPTLSVYPIQPIRIGIDFRQPEWRTMNNIGPEVKIREAITARMDSWQMLSEPYEWAVI